MIDHLEDLDGQGPLWQQIRRALVKPIVEGRWTPDQKIPKEFEIIERYGAARMTVHRALRSLATEGYITRKRRFGSVVAAQPPERPVLEIWDIAAEVARLGAVYSFAILKRQILPGDNRKAAALEAGADDRVLHLTARHFSDGAPLQYEERLVNLSVAPAAADENFTGIAPGSWLIHNIPWRQAEHTISAESAPAGIAKLLDIPAQTACLVVERRTWNDAGLPITWARLVHPGDKRRLVGRFQSDWD